jgi:hypothetical protein
LQNRYADFGRLAVMPVSELEDRFRLIARRPSIASEANCP